MFENKEKLELSNLVDIKLLQEFQDSFAETMNIASITFDEKGPITEPSNFTDFYTILKSSEVGLKKYNECQLKYGKIEADSCEFVIYTCDTGLTEFIVPIIVAGEHIGSILGGQVLTEQPDEKRFRENARELGISEDDYIKALRKIKVVSTETVNKAANLLITIANIISDIAHKNLELIKKNEREKLIANNIAKAVCTLDVREISRIVNDVGVIMKADRCYFIEADYENLTGKPVESYSEYLLSPDIKSINEFKFSPEDFLEFLNVHLKVRDVVIFDYENIPKNQNKQYLKLVENYTIVEINEEQYPRIKKYGNLFTTKIAIGIPFFYLNEFKGILVVEYIKKRVLPSADELDFLRILGNQMGMAINQIQLYQNAKKTAERESSLRKIFEAMRSSLDSNIIKSTIVNELGKVLDVNTCSIVAYDSKDDYFYVDEYSEYLSNPGEKSLVNADEKDPKFKWFVDAFRNNIEVSFSNVEEFIVENKLQGTPEEDFLREYNIKSAYDIPIYYANSLLGYIYLGYTKNHKKLNESDLDFLRNLATQAGVAIYQANLYKKMQLQAEKEKLLADMITKAISTLDINEIRKIVKDIGIMMKADRCYFVEINQEEKEGKLIDFDDEYLSSPEIKSAVGYEFPVYDVEKFFKSAKVTASAFDFEKSAKELSENFPLIKKYGEVFSVRSGIGVPFMYMNKFKGVLSIEYTKENIQPSEEELNFLSILGNQIGMAINQIQLYQNTTKTAEREKFGRNIIEILRNATDKSTIKHLFVKNIGKYFNADRVFFSDFDSETNLYLPVDKDSEYLSNSEEKSFVDYDWSNETLSEYIQPLIEKRELKISCWDEYIKEKAMSESFIARFEGANVKSSYNFPVLYQQRIMGYFCIEFTRQVFKLSDEDIINIRSICMQAGIALHQAELFLKMQNHSQKQD